MGKRPLEIYIHIPFCIKKCAYCDFLSAPAGEEVQKAYVDALLREMRGAVSLSETYEVTTVFLGGGTPSILRSSQIGELLALLKEQYSIREHAEITMEANPGTVDAEKLKGCREAGVNRISFGLQSADDRELRALGRIHTWEQFLESFHLARQCGFTNINVDLMSALPGQTVESWRETLRKVLELGPEHISAYSLIIEEGTPFYEIYGDHPELLPSEEEERQMYYDTREILRAHGYERYEISNYARKGYACRHNLGYWDRTEYKGFGLGSASLLENMRTSNQTELSAYLNGEWNGTSEILTEQAIREEYFFLGLRRMDGVKVGRYRAHYGALIDKLIRQGLLEAAPDASADPDRERVRLTDKGIDVSNYVLAQFLDD